MTRRRRVVIGLAVIAIVLFIGEIWRDRANTEEAVLSYQQALADTAASARLPAGSEEESAAIARFEDFWSSFTADRIRHKMADTYADELYFNDTVKTIRTRAELEHYMVESAAAVHACTVDVQDVATSAGGYYFRWVMEIRFKKLAGGEPTRSIGVSHVRFDADGRVILHQDHWDSAAGIYQHVPVLGWMIRKVQERM